MVDLRPRPRPGARGFHLITAGQCVLVRGARAIGVPSKSESTLPRQRSSRPLGLDLPLGVGEGRDERAMGWSPLPERETAREVAAAAGVASGGVGGGVHRFLGATGVHIFSLCKDLPSSLCKKLLLRLCTLPFCCLCHPTHYRANWHHYVLHHHHYHQQIPVPPCGHHPDYQPPCSCPPISTDQSSLKKEKN